MKLEYHEGEWKITNASTIHYYSNVCVWPFYIVFKSLRPHLHVALRFLVDRTTSTQGWWHSHLFFFQGNFLSHFNLMLQNKLQLFTKNRSSSSFCCCSDSHKTTLNSVALCYSGLLWEHCISYSFCLQTKLDSKSSKLSRTHLHLYLVMCICKWID